MHILKKKVTCGQCCKTPGGSCDCHVKMTYVKVIKYTTEVFEGERCHLGKIYSQSHKKKREMIHLFLLEVLIALPCLMAICVLCYKQFKLKKETSSCLLENRPVRKMLHSCRINYVR